MIRLCYITVEPFLMANLLIWPPCYYGNFNLAQTKARSITFLSKEPLNYSHPVNTVSLLYLK